MTNTTTANPSIDITKLKAGTIITMETEIYLYVLTVYDPARKLVFVETGAPNLAPDDPYEISNPTKGVPCSFRAPPVGRDETPLIAKSSPVALVDIAGVDDLGTPWSYKVF